MLPIKEADLLCKTFGPADEPLHYWPGHEIVEMGLAKFTASPATQRYLDLAKYFIDVRGSHPGGDDYHQSRIPPVEQTEAIGHAVRAGYLYSGMADVAALTGDTDYIHAIDKIWENCVGKKLYLTGGIGAGIMARRSAVIMNCPISPPTMKPAPPWRTIFGTSGFTCCTATPNMWTCWNARFTTACSPASRSTARNSSIRTRWNAAVTTNAVRGSAAPAAPETSRGSCRRCPAIFTRTRTAYFREPFRRRRRQTSNWMMAAVKITVTQETRYPWDGAVKITVAPDKKSAAFTDRRPHPGWARNEAVPGDLYQFSDSAPTDPVTLKVNGKSTSPLNWTTGLRHLEPHLEQIGRRD
jgi:hypothetical protein